MKWFLILKSALKNTLFLDQKNESIKVWLKTQNRLFWQPNKTARAMK
jgi:hypothetical protein